MLWEILWRNKNTFTLGFCLIFSIVCIIWQSNPFAQKVGYIGRLTDRVSSAINSWLSFTGNLWVELDKYRELEERYNQAQTVLQQYRLEKDKFDHLQRENRALRAALGFQLSQSYQETRAEVLGLRLNTISPRLIVGKGREDGISSFMPVIAISHDDRNRVVRSIAGIVVKADAATSVVQPIIHPSFQVGVRIESSGEWAILSGNSGRLNEVLLTYITSNLEPGKALMSQSEDKLKSSDIVYSSGADGIFPVGIPIGSISEVGYNRSGFKTAYVRLFASISKLNHVIIVKKPVETWANSWEDDQRWQEQLQTEFGPAQYSEETAQPSPKKAQKRKTAAQSRPKQEKAASTSVQEQTVSDKVAPPQRRRVQNLQVPTN